MDPGLLDMLHHGTNDGILPVRNAVDIHLGGGLKKAIEKDGAAGSNLGALFHITADFILRIDNPHGSSPENKGGAKEKRKTDFLGCNQGLLGRGCGAIGGLAEAQLIQHGGEELSVLGALDRFHGGSEDSDAGRLQLGSQIQGRLSSELNDDTLD